MWKSGKPPTMDFYLVTDSGLSRAGTADDVKRALDAGCRIVQYREKHKETGAMIEEALAIRMLCENRAVFLVNDRVDVALAVDADGVHVGQDDMPFEMARRILGPDRIIGLTAHDVPESVEAERLGADYIGLSPIFTTATKADAGKACGLAMIGEVQKHVNIPIVAIGGIDAENIAGVIGAGADAAVAISAVLCAEDVGAATAEMIEIIRKSRS